MVYFKKNTAEIQSAIASKKTKTLHVILCDEIHPKKGSKSDKITCKNWLEFLQDLEGSSEEENVDGKMGLEKKENFENNEAQESLEHPKQPQKTHFFLFFGVSTDDFSAKKSLLAPNMDVVPISEIRGKRVEIV